MIATALQAGGALSALAQYHQFILVKLAPDYANPGKTYKYPVSISNPHEVCNAHDPAIWLSAETACQWATMLGDGYCVGFVFTVNDPFFFIDIDGAWNGAEWSQLAQKFCSDFAGCAVEVSQSGTGLHIFGKLAARPDHACKNTALHLEFYTEARFAALTGLHAVGDANTDATLQAYIAALEYFPKGVDTDTDWTDKPVEEYGEELPDEVIIERAKRSKSAASTFGAKASFKELFNADVERLAHVYPHATKPYDASSADAALASILAFWCGKNCTQIDRIMRASRLARPKWDYHKSYMKLTITSACGRQGEVYKPREQKVAVENVAPPISAATGSVNRSPTALLRTTAGQWMNAEEQITYFSGCVYVQDQDRILTPSGALLKQSQFKAMYGGYLFEFSRGNKAKDKTNPWEVFTESQIVDFPKVESTCFMPDKMQGEIIDNKVNSFVPKWGKRISGDITPFMNHVKKLLPIESDRELLLSYMAACVQMAGTKFQWAPLIQGVQGNGKTMLINCVEYALGEDYVHRPNGTKLGSNFNGWMRGKLLIAVEEVYMSDRVDLYEYLKDKISNARLEIEAKGVEQGTDRVVCNFMFASNHRDGMLKKSEDRRCCPFFTAQQTKDDLRLAGMTGDYFKNLYSWLRNGGYGIVADYLWTRPITCNMEGEAPVNSFTNAAIKESHGLIEDLVLDAIERGEQGLSGDIVLGHAVQMFLERRNKTISPRKIALVMREIGFIKPTCLEASEGRLSINGQRHKVYVRMNSAAETMTPDQLLETYQRGNMRQIFPPLAIVNG